MSRRWTAATTFLLSALMGSPTLAADSPNYEKARREGEVRWYTTNIIDTGVIPIITAFEKRYPGVKVIYSRGDSPQTVVKILNEAKAGRLEADVVGGTGTSAPLQKAGLLTTYKVMNWDAIPAERKDPNGYWTSNILYFHTPAVNTDLVKAADIPAKLEDLLAPKWKGKIAWSTSSLGGPAFIGSVLVGMGQEKGMEFLRKLAKQEIINLGVSARAAVERVSASEYAVALGILNFHAQIDADKGAPIRWLPLEPVLGTFSVEAVLKDAPRPNAARLFVDFLMSEDAARVLANAGFLPALASVPAKTPSLKPEGGNFKANFVTPDFLAENTEKWMALRKELFE